MKTNNKGFTLVELIIVIAVIGVLAAILIPVFSNMIEKANNKSALSDAKNALEIYIADSIDYTGGLPIGEGSVFKIKKANKDWYYTYYENALHEGTGAENANALRPIPIPENSIKIMASDSVYISEQDATTEIYDNLPNTVIIYNTGANATYTPPTEDIEYDGDFILISKQSQLTSEFLTANGMDKKYKLKNDITLTGNFTPINDAFTGEFNGNGKTISGLNINEPDKVSVALFRQVNGAKLYNFTLIVNNIVGKGEVGTVCGNTNGGIFTDIHVKINGMVSDVETDPDDAFTGRGCVGGFGANGSNTAIVRCSVTGEVRCKSGTSNLGGFLSHLTGTTMTECFFSGNLVGRSAAGLARYAFNSAFENCYVKASYEGVHLAVGILSTTPNDTENRIKNCVSICTGFSIADENDISAAAFVVDYYDSCEVTNCYTLSDSPLTQHPYKVSGNNASESGTLISSFSQANCPGLNENGIVWSFDGEYPTLVNNPE